MIRHAQRRDEGDDFARGRLAKIVTEQVVDNVERFCRDCGYSLQGLTECRCPECGQGFDPADARTYHTRGRSGPIIRFLLKPLGWPTCLAAIVTLLMIGWAHSVPGGCFGMEVNGGLLGLAVIGMWLLRVGGGWVAWSYFAAGVRMTFSVSNGRWRWTLPPCSR